MILPNSEEEIAITSGEQHDALLREHDERLRLKRESANRRRVWEIVSGRDPSDDPT